MELDHDTQGIPHEYNPSAPNVLLSKRKKDFAFRTEKKNKRTLQCKTHLHQHVEILYLKEGDVTVMYDGKKYDLTSGDFLIVFPYKLHTYVSNTLVLNEDGSIAEVEKFSIVIFNPNLVPPLADFFSTTSPVCPVIRHDTPGTDELQDIMHSLWHVSTIKKRHDLNREEITLIRSGLLLAICQLIFKKIELVESVSSSTPLAKSITNYCIANYHENITLESIAKELGISKFYVSRIFTQKMNVKFNDYINSLRVIEACNYLRNTQKSVNEISELVGFSTQRTFNRAFTKQFGLSPSDYRKTQAGDVDISML